MTSIPASRSARAMIFAPRSWPSRPGLATTTRIFLVVGAAGIERARGFGAPRRAEGYDARLARAERHVHPRVDGADDRVPAAAADAARERAGALVAGAELLPALRHGDVVRVVADPAPADGVADADRQRSGAEDVVVDAHGLGRSRC